ncbi:MAG: restriction endonuclease subunit S [Bacteroidales bacterium]|nr:restriction endonuclease subunit S [Candidatus Scybalocola fimicaballi]
MNRIQELIKELCPNGVEWKTLGEIGTFVRGNGLQKSDFKESGIGCIHYGQIYTYYGLFTDKTKSFVSPDLAEKLKKVEPGDIILACTSENIEDVCKCVVWEGTDIIVTGGHASIFKHNQNPRYIAYFFKSSVFEKQKIKYVYGAKVIDIKNDDLAKIEIPLPPLPVQTEIVRILDKFVEQQEQLEKLIALRTKQYEYYREEMLTAKEGEEWETKTLGEIAKISIGKKPNNILEKGAFEYINAGTTCSGYSDDYNFEGDVITTPSRGEGGIGFVGYQNKRFWCGPLCYVIDTSENNKFIYHYLSLHNNLILDLKCEGGVPALNRKDLVTIKLQIPTKDIQNEIVKTLDSFESSISALTSALELSKKRYEHYRDEMLRF